VVYFAEWGGYADINFLRSWYVWPVTWLLHGLFYRGQWVVEIYERRLRGRFIMGGGRVVYSHILPSRRDAREDRRRIADRIQELSRGDSTQRRFPRGLRRHPISMCALVPRLGADPGG
jgi:hypothetical protein